MDKDWDKEADDFQYFYDLYANKKAPKAARSAWFKLSIADRQLACKGLEDRVKNDRQWLNGFQPHPSTYLNGRRWEDSWDRHVPLKDRPDNVRNTEHERLNPKQEQQGLERLEAIAPQTPCESPKNALEKMYELLGQSRITVPAATEEELQDRKDLLAQQAKDLLRKGK